MAPSWVEKCCGLDGGRSLAHFSGAHCGWEELVHMELSQCRSCAQSHVKKWGRMSQAALADMGEEQGRISLTLGTIWYLSAKANEPVSKTLNPLTLNHVTSFCSWFCGKKPYFRRFLRTITKFWNIILPHPQSSWFCSGKWNHPSNKALVSAGSK